MKKIMIFLILLNPLVTMTQQIDYYPEQKKNVSDADYRYGIKILEETYKKVQYEKGIFNYADYWNLGVAYITLEEDPALIREMLQKSRIQGGKYFAELFLYANNANPLNKWRIFLTEEEYNLILKDSESRLAEGTTEMKNNEAYNESCIDYDEELIALIKMLYENDRKFRFIKEMNIKQQRILDQQNIKIIDSLVDVHQTYIGESLVPAKYKYVMWSVIQHSNLKNMEKYLPLIYEAAQKEELEEDMLKMLLDRIYFLKCDYQIYGSQGSKIPIGPEEEIEPIKKRYKLNNN